LYSRRSQAGQIRDKLLLVDGTLDLIFDMLNLMHELYYLCPEYSVCDADVHALARATHETLLSMINNAEGEYNLIEQRTRLDNSMEEFNQLKEVLNGIMATLLEQKAQLIKCKEQPEYFSVDHAQLKNSLGQLKMFLVQHIGALLRMIVEIKHDCMGLNDDDKRMMDKCYESIAANIVLVSQMPT
jgi:hypothetical protein